MSKVLSLRLQDEQVQRLGRLARRWDRSPSETAGRLLEEAMRRAEFALIDFRDSPAGRQAYIQGSSLAVWEVVMVARSYGLDVAATAGHLEWAPSRVQAALNYSQAHPEEIESALEDNGQGTLEALSRLQPGIEPFHVANSAG